MVNDSVVTSVFCRTGLPLVSWIPFGSSSLWGGCDVPVDLSASLLSAFQENQEAVGHPKQTTP